MLKARRPALAFFLFILVMEGLNSAISDAVHSEWISHNMDNIIHVLWIFYLASGLKINIHKSNVYGIGVSAEE
ncbi:hypothetical protein Tco_0131319, partial [Tanacetum coccineum]